MSSEPEDFFDKLHRVPVDVDKLLRDPGDDEEDGEEDDS